MAETKHSGPLEQNPVPELSRAGATCWLIGLTVLAFLVRYRVGYYQKPYFDGCGYIMHAWSLLDWRLTTTYWSKDYDHYYQPVYPFLISLFYRMTKDWTQSAQLVNHILGALLLIPFYLLGRRVYGTIGGVFSAALLVSYPLLVENSSNPMSEPAFLLFFGFGLYCLYCLVEERKSGYALLTGIFFGISYLSRAQAAIFIPITFPYLLWLVYRKRLGAFSAIKYFLLIAVCFYLLALPYDLYCYNKDGVYALRAKQEFFKKIGEPQTTRWYIEERSLDAGGREFPSYTLARQSSPLKYVISNPGKYLDQIKIEAVHCARAMVRDGALLNPLIVILVLLSLLVQFRGSYPAEDIRKLNPYWIWLFFFALIPPLTAPAPNRYYVGMAPIFALFGAGALVFLIRWSGKSILSRGISPKLLIWFWALLALILYPHARLLILCSRDRNIDKDRARFAMAGWLQTRLLEKGKIIMSEDPFAAMSTGNYWYMLPLDWPMRAINYAQVQSADYVLFEEHLFRWTDSPSDWSNYFLTPSDKPGLKFVAGFPEGQNFPIAVLYKMEKPGPKPEKKTSLIFISIGSLRADHLSAYGYSQKTSPNIDALAGQGLIFENARTASVSEGWGLLSLLSSVWLDGTIHIAQIVPQVQKELGDLKIDLLPAMLAGNGYQVLAFGKVLNKSDPAGAVQFEGLKMFQPGIEKLDPQSMDNILNSLEKIDRGRPFALFLNTPGDLLWRDNISGRTGNRTVEEMVSQYDANIKNADAWLGKLFLELRARNLMDEQTLVVISSDRGASLGEHGAIGQERLYQESTRVPLILHWPGRLPSKVIKSQVRTVDVVPTIFDLFGIPMPGQVQGASLRPMLDAEIDLSAFIESSVKEPASGAENIRVDQALCDPLWLYYQTRPEPMLFSLANDRAENINLLHFPEQLFANLPGPARDQKLKQIQSIHEFLSADVKNYNYYNLRHLRKFSGAAPQD